MTTLGFNSITGNAVIDEQTYDIGASQFPAGEHFDMNLQKAVYACNPAPGGNSIFVLDNGEIQLIFNRRSMESFAIDPCSLSLSDPAKVQLPSGNYDVYAKVGKTSKDVVFHPRLKEVSDSGESLINLGSVTADPSVIVEDITDLFQWSGYVCDQKFDVDNDGEISTQDIESDQDGDSDIDGKDLTMYLELSCSYFSNEWIFNIADLAMYGWNYNTMGSKQVTVSFYQRN